MDIGFAGALLGGLITLFSPCSALLLPAFFAYAFTSPAQLISRTGIFYLGLLSTLVPLGVLAGFVGGLLTEHRRLLVVGASVLVIVFGLIQVLGLRLPFTRPAATQGGTTIASVYVLGMVYGVAGVCTGPILGSVLTVAGISGSAVYGAVLLALYALGMTVPLFVLALVWDRLGSRGRKAIRPGQLRIGRWSNSWVMVVSGLISITIGVLLLLTDGTTSLGGVLGASEQFALESRIQGLAATIPDAALVAGAMVVVTGALLTVLLRRNHIDRK